MKILLIGIGGVYNYGCEAIIRGTTEILKNIIPNVEISYASYNYKYDKKKLNDLDINIVKRFDRSNRWRVKNIIRKLMSYFNVDLFSGYDSISLVKKYDAIFSIGGDIYTLNDKNEAYTQLPEYIDACLRAYPKLKYILWGASVGPFDNNKQVLEYYKVHLQKAQLIVAREDTTIAYLKSIGISKNVCFAPDPAYYVPFTQQKCNKSESDVPVIGVNLSPLSARYIYSNINDAIAIQARAISNLIIGLNARIVMIPHVLSADAKDDDLSYLEKIAGLIPEHLKSSVEILRQDEGFIGRKKTLENLDYMIAARMHCGINAVTCGIPTLFMSYSAKAKAMARYIYGNEKSVLPLTELENTSSIIRTLQNLERPMVSTKIKDFDFSTIIDRISDKI